MKDRGWKFSNQLKFNIPTYLNIAKNKTTGNSDGFANKIKNIKEYFNS